MESYYRLRIENLGVLGISINLFFGVPGTIPVYFYEAQARDMTHDIDTPKNVYEIEWKG
jgi:hypothetical protein